MGSRENKERYKFRKICEWCKNKIYIPNLRMMNLHMSGVQQRRKKSKEKIQDIYFNFGDPTDLFCIQRKMVVHYGHNVLETRNGSPHAKFDNIKFLHSKRMKRDQMKMNQRREIGNKHLNNYQEEVKGKQLYFRMEKEKVNYNKHFRLKHFKKKGFR